MKLLRKSQLLQLVEKEPLNKLLREPIIDYARTIDSKQKEYYNALYFVKNLKDEDYCGIGLNEKANFYLYDFKTNTYYWFVTASDAIKYANSFVKNGLPFNADAFVKERAFVDLFNTNNMNKFQGFYLVKSHSIEIFSVDVIKDIKEGKKVRCIEKNIIFTSVQDAADWLVSIGKAKNKITAIRSLERNISGNSIKSYGMKWERI